MLRVATYCLESSIPDICSHFELGQCLLSLILTHSLSLFPSPPLYPHPVQRVPFTHGYRRWMDLRPFCPIDSRSNTTVYSVCRTN